MSAVHPLIISAAALSMAIGVRVGAATNHLLREASATLALDTPSIWPTSIAGWAALFLAAVSCIAIFVGWGKMLGRFDDIRTKLNDLSSRVSAIQLSTDRIQEELTVVEHTLWGARGDNGMSLDVREMVRRVDAIESRNNIRDALYERERGAAQNGDERRSRHRRGEDRILLGEEEVKR